MDYYGRIQDAVEFIENNLKEQIVLNAVARTACFSLFHFHRIFNGMVGMTVKEYIRKRRMSEAAHELYTTSKKIINIAFDFQYETPESFSKAFKKMYGVTPVIYRKGKMERILFEKVDVFENRNYLLNEGIIKMEPEIISKKGFKVIGMQMQSSTENDRNLKEISSFWDRFNIKRIYSTIPNASKNSHVYGVCTEWSDSESSFSYTIGVEVDSFDAVPGDMVALEIPVAKYAVFKTEGKIPDIVKETGNYVFGTWLPDSDYELVEGPVFALELFERKVASTDSCRYVLYIPIKYKC